MAEVLQINTNLPEMMGDAANECKSPAVTIGFQVALSRLKRIAMRALEIGDTEILDELVSLGIIKKG